MYLAHYKLKELPFQITTDPKFLWLGEKHKEALSVLRYGIMENKGFVLLTGEVGTGKTVLIHGLIDMLDPNTVVATIPDPGLKGLDFFNFLAHCFHLEGPFEHKGDFLIQLRRFLTYSQAAGRPVLLIIDEAQRLEPNMLEEIRLLSNIELHDRKLIHIFFVGQPEFYDVLQDARNRALSQRITVKYRIEPLTLEETHGYVRHRLAVAGSKRLLAENRKALFGPRAVREIFEFSGGVPRLINIVADHALLTGFARGIHQIDAEIVRECAQELHIPVQAPGRPSESDRRRSAEEIRLQTMEEIKELVVSGIRAAAGSVSDEKKAAVQTSGPHVAETSAAPASPEAPKKARRSVLRTALLGVLMALLLLVAGYQWSRHTTGESPLWGMEELTSTKYKVDLEEKKRTLEARLSQNPVAGDEGAPIAGAQEQPPEVPPMPAGAQDGDAPARPPTPGSAPPGVDAAAPARTAAVPAADAPPVDESDPAAPKGDPQAETPVLRDAPTVPFPGNHLRIFFQVNSNEVAAEAYETLDRIAAYLAAHPEARIDVKGYSDSQGSRGYNRSVSGFRAHVVKSYLIGKGAAAAAIRTIGRGERDPIADNATAQGRQRNRRVEIEFTAGVPDEAS